MKLDTIENLELSILKFLPLDREKLKTAPLWIKKIFWRGFVRIQLITTIILCAGFFFLQGDHSIIIVFLSTLPFYLYFKKWNKYLKGIE